MTANQLQSLPPTSFTRRQPTPSLVVCYYSDLIFFYCFDVHIEFFFFKLVINWQMLLMTCFIPYQWWWCHTKPGRCWKTREHRSCTRSDRRTRRDDNVIPVPDDPENDNDTLTLLIIPQLIWQIWRTKLRGWTETSSDGSILDDPNLLRRTSIV